MSSRPISSLSIPRQTLAALTRAGYETLHDISTSSAEAIARGSPNFIVNLNENPNLLSNITRVECGIPLPASQDIFSVSSKSNSMTPTHAPPVAQSAASMITKRRTFSTRCAPVDKLLSGGLPRGHILEISGPPGTFKEAIAVNVVRSFVEAGEEVLFVDSQNMVSPAALNKALSNSAEYQKLIYHINIYSPPEYLIFMNTLQSFLELHPRIALLVLNSISFPFQSASLLSIPARNAHLERVKQVLTRACASTNLAVITTSQLATKLVNADGSAGNYDTGSRAVMVPQLGPGYLPGSRAYRIIIVPETRTTGVVRLISSPTYKPGNGRAPQETYSGEDSQCDLTAPEVVKSDP